MYFPGEMEKAAILAAAGALLLTALLTRCSPRQDNEADDQPSLPEVTKTSQAVVYRECHLNSPRRGARYRDLSLERLQELAGMRTPFVREAASRDPHSRDHSLAQVAK